MYLNIVRVLAMFKGNRKLTSHFLHLQYIGYRHWLKHLQNIGISQKKSYQAVVCILCV